MRERADMRAWSRHRWRDLTERFPPSVLLGGGVVLVFLLFGALALAILHVEGGLDDLGLRPPEDAPATSGDDGADDGEPGATDLAQGLAVDGSPAGAGQGEAQDGTGEAAEHVPAESDGEADAAAGPATALDGGDATAGTGGGDASSPPGSSTPTTRSSAPATTQPPTTSSPTTESPDESTEGGLLGGLLDLLGLEVSPILG